jgi:hypothetical protein
VSPEELAARQERNWRRLQLLLRLKRLEDTIRLARSDMAWVRKQLAELKAVKP